MNAMTKESVGRDRGSSREPFLLPFPHLSFSPFIYTRQANLEAFQNENWEHGKGDEPTVEVTMNASMREHVERTKGQAGGLPVWLFPPFLPSQFGCVPQVNLEPFQNEKLEHGGGEESVLVPRRHRIVCGILPSHLLQHNHA